MFTYVVLDSTEITRDWLLRGLAFRLLRHLQRDSALSVGIPASVIEEVVANNERAVAETRTQLKRLNRIRRQLGQPVVHEEPSKKSDYRAMLAQVRDEVLGFDVLPWPNVSHTELVARATGRVPPFDSKGGGYRDSLVWHTALELARAGNHVALVSADVAFADKSGGLREELASEVADANGKVELVRDLNIWVLGLVPWKTDNLAEAAGIGRDEQFDRYLFESDIFELSSPEPEDLGLPESTTRVEVLGIELSGAPERLSVGRAEDDLLLVEYDVPIEVDVRAEMSQGDADETVWSSGLPDVLNRVIAEATLDMLMRVAVVYDSYDVWTGVEYAHFRRADGTPKGLPQLGHVPGQLPLWVVQPGVEVGEDDAPAP